MPLDVDAVLFDLDDTLCAYERSVEELVELAFERAGVDPFFDGETYRIYFDRNVSDFDDVDRLREHCFAEIASDEGRDPEVGRAVAAEYAAARDPARVEPRPGAIDAVHELAERVPVGLITNGTRDLQRDKLERIGLADAFDAVVYAGTDTAPKPDPEPFERALTDLGVEPERAVHVGNSLRSDVGGAATLGLRTVWTPTDPELPEDVDDPTALAGDPDAVPGWASELEARPDRALATLGDLPALLANSRS